MKGENNPNSKINLEIANKIREDLKDWSIPRKTIIKNYHVSADIIRHINDGDTWRDDSIDYPIRPKEKILNDLKVEQIIKTILLTEIPLNQIGPKYGWGRSSAKMINSGKNHYNKNLIYPLRKNKEMNKKLLNL